jgi:hypothetical protein
MAKLAHLWAAMGGEGVPVTVEDDDVTWDVRVVPGGWWRWWWCVWRGWSGSDVNKQRVSAAAAFTWAFTWAAFDGVLDGATVPATPARGRSLVVSNARWLAAAIRRGRGQFGASPPRRRQAAARSTLG